MARKASAVDIYKSSIITKLTVSPTVGGLKLLSPAHSTPERRKYFNFSFLRDAGPSGPKIARAFVHCMETREEATANGFFWTFATFLRYVLKRTARERMLLDELFREDWQLHVDSYVFALKSNSSLADITKNMYVRNMKLLWEELRKRELLPRVKWPAMIPQATYVHRPPTSQAKVSEVSTVVAAWDEEDHELWNRLESLTNISRPSIEAQRISIINALIRKHAEKDVRTIWAKYQTAQDAISNNTSFDVSAYCAHFEQREDGYIRRRRGWREQLSKLENVLVYIHANYGGVLPGRVDDPHFRKFLYERYGSELTSCFHLDYSTLIPFLAIILQGRPKMNVSSPLSMTVDDLQSLNRNEISAKWVKKRANYRRIRDFIPKGRADSLQPESQLEIGPAEALMAVSELSQRLRPYAVTGLGNRLILVRHTYGGRAASHSPCLGAVSSAWTKWRTRAGPLALLNFTLSQLRPTAALQEFLTSGDISKVQEQLGQVSTRHTVKYITGLAAESVDAEPVREVQDALTLLLAKKSHRAVTTFGLDAARAQEIGRAADAAGFLGYHLTSDPNQSEPVPSCLERILSNSTYLIFDTPEVAAECIAFKEHLIANARSIRETERYNALWLPLMAILAEVVDNMSPSTVLAARSILAKQPLQYGPIT
ncbi:hypothetical protein RHAB21_01665 [Pseudorhizobium halotolerans]|uniref:Core-binding (CB) domain-containing protein n=1 Tax=Pseudorhizobium halotolerans TaxID=1233081 RepID=A0ABN7JLZ2_9HYPH|nr:hypothetical protein [Pseudorhizobium halotolerans]CAD7029966.1 hypothetical protein RHAB21_01665 [Pseudorhizobium halotolerans]